MPQTPEYTPSIAEIDEITELISGMDELSSTWGYSGTEYATETLERMRHQGIEINPFTMSIVLRHSFGDPEALLSRMDGRTAEELDLMLPGEIGVAVVDYLQPVLEQE